MAIKDQVKKLKDNWLLIVIALVLIVLIKGGEIGTIPLGASMRDNVAYETASAPSYSKGIPMPSYAGAGNALDILERKVEMTGSLTSVVPQGTFDANQARALSIVNAQKGIVLNQNVYTTDSTDTVYGSYTFKVPNNVYEYVVTELKKIGKVESFSANAADITETYVNTQIEIEIEKGRLDRINKLYVGNASLDERLRLENFIYDQERKIKYLEDSNKNNDERVNYATLQLTLREETPSYATIQLAKMGDLSNTFVESLNGLLFMVSGLLPWGVGLIIVLMLWKIGKKIF